MPLVTVILPVYNTEKYIAEAVQSILNQTFKDFELLVINDASTDNTLAILENFTDARLKIITNPVNFKVVKSLNRGIEQAKGEFIARMDADDISLPQRLEKQIELLQSEQHLDVCGSWVQKFGDENEIHAPATTHDEIKGALLFHNIIIHPTVMFRKKSFEVHGFKYDEGFINAEDYGLWEQAIDRLKFALIPEVLLKYRIHDNNVSVHKASNWQVVKDMNFKVYRSFLSKLNIHPTEEELNMHINLGFGLIENISSAELKMYLQWLNWLSAANTKSKYIKEAVFREQFVQKVCNLTSNKAMSSPRRLIERLKIFFSNQLLTSYLSHKVKLAFRNH